MIFNLAEIQVPAAEHAEPSKVLSFDLSPSFPAVIPHLCPRRNYAGSSILRTFQFSGAHNQRHALEIPYHYNYDDDDDDDDDYHSRDVMATIMCMSDPR